MANKEPSPQKRLFFALWLDERAVNKIQQHVTKYFVNCQGRFVESNNWHITLAYFGAADINTQRCIEEHAAKITSQPFTLNLSKCGWWPKPKAAWLAPDEIPNVLKELMHDLQHTIEPCGFKVETRDFQPHITLVRKAKQLPSVSEVKAISLPVTRFFLAESKTYSQGAQYTVLKSWGL